MLLLTSRLTHSSTFDVAISRASWLNGYDVTVKWLCDDDDDVEDDLGGHSPSQNIVQFLGKMDEILESHATMIERNNNRDDGFDPTIQCRCDDDAGVKDKVEDELDWYSPSKNVADGIDLPRRRDWGMTMTLALCVSLGSHGDAGMVVWSSQIIAAPL